jgi:hypothetical protein
MSEYPYPLFANIEHINIAAAASLNSSNYEPFAPDTGTTVSISPIHEDFYTFEVIAPLKIWGIGNMYIEAVTKGEVYIHSDGGHIFILSNVCYVPDTALQLMSVGRVTDKQYTAAFNSTEIILVHQDDDTNTVVLTAACHNKKLYVVNSSIIPSPSLSNAVCVLAAHPGSPVSTNFEVWHRRLGHISVSTICKMAERGLAEGMPVDLSELPPACKHCFLRKQTRTPVPKTRTHARSKRKLGVVYADLMGPEAVESIRHNLYSRELIDKYTDMTWCIPLQSKPQAFPELKQWGDGCRMECGLDVGIYCIDGGELKSDQMREYLTTAGMKLQTTAPHTSLHIDGQTPSSHRF